MIDTIAAFDGRLAKVEGAERSGKTQALVARCAHLIQNGEAPASILVAVTNAFAAQAFRKRLRRALPANFIGAALSVRVCTALDAAVSVLGEPAAREATGRVSRILNSAEYNFFLEDLKTIGEHPRKLRSMLGFLDRKMAGYEPRGEWNAGTAADNLLAYATRILKLRGAMLAGEAPMLAADFLKSDAGESARGSFAYVLADDFQNFSHAEQTVLCLLADKQIMVTGNPNQMMSKRGNHPYIEGFLKFEAVRRDVEVFHLQGAFGNPQIIALADALCTEGDMDSAYIAGNVTSIERAAGAEGLPQGVQSIKWNTPEDELNGLTKYLRKLMDGQEDTREANTCVVVPNRRWAVMVEKMLRRRGFNVSAAGAAGTLAGDPRDSTRSRALMAYTKLGLLADPTDMIAWRSWCGFDNALTNSDAWMGLQDFAEAEGLTLYQALQQVGNAGFGAKEPFLRARTLAEKWRSGQDFLEKNATRRGFGLMKAIGAEGISEFEAVAADMVGDETARAGRHLRPGVDRGPARRAHLPAAEPVRHRVRQHVRGRLHRRLLPAAQRFRGDQHRRRTQPHHGLRAPRLHGRRGEGQAPAGAVALQQGRAGAGRAHEDAGGAREKRERQAHGHRAPVLLPERGRRRRPHHHGWPGAPGGVRLELGRNRI